MAEHKEFSICECGKKYRSDGAYAKEVCPGCLPARLGYVRTPQQEAALTRWRIELGYDKQAASAA